MKCIVLNDDHRLSRLGGANVSFAAVEKTDDDTYREGLLCLMRRPAEPFVLLWHEQPAVGLHLLSDLKKNSALPAGWQGCVFFRAAAYAGLVNEQSARDCLKKSELSDRIHIFAERVPEIAPGEAVVSRLARFVDAVGAITNTEVALPFKLLDPPPREAGLITLLLAGRLIQDGRLSAEDVMAALNWRPIIQEGQRAGYSLGLLPDEPTPAPLQVIRYLGQYADLLRESVKWRCDLCEQRHMITHTTLDRQLHEQATFMKNQGSNPAEVSTLLEHIAAVVVAINRQQDWLAPEGNLIRAAAASQIAPYLKAGAIHVLDEMTRLVRDQFQMTCCFYLNREAIERQVRQMRQAADELAAQPADESREAERHLGDIIAIVTQIKALLQCPTPPRSHEVILI